jgi:hypothetical protein
MPWQEIGLLTFLCLSAILFIIQTFRAWLWKNKYMTLIKNLRLGEKDGQTEENSN